MLAGTTGSCGSFLPKAKEMTPFGSTENPFHTFLGIAGFYLTTRNLPLAQGELFLGVWIAYETQQDSMKSDWEENKELQ